MHQHITLTKRKVNNNNEIKMLPNSNPKVNPTQVDEHAVTEPFRESADETPTMTPPPQKTAHPIAVAITAINMGIVFGFSFVRSRVYEPLTIRKQFILEDFSMMKMFLAAVSASSVAYIFMHLFHLEDFQGMRDRRANSGSGRGLGWVAVGGAILGAGMSIGGGCPGMVLSQVGSGVKNSYATLLGGIIGALVYGLLEPKLRVSIQKNARGISKAKSLHMETKLGTSYRKMTFAVFVITTLFVILLEFLYHWEDQLEWPNVKGCVSYFTCRAVSPWFAGMLLGLLQVPTFYIMNSALGSSSSYVTIAGAWVQAHPTAQELFEYLKKASAFNMSTWWQVFYMAAAAGGSALAQYLSHGPPARGIPVEQGFIGGFLMLFGARIAAGCTSGHGLSGMPLLMLNSLVAVLAMFAGGFATGFAFSAIDRDSYLQL